MRYLELIIDLLNIDLKIIELLIYICVKKLCYRYYTISLAFILNIHAIANTISRTRTYAITKA